MEHRHTRPVDAFRVYRGIYRPFAGLATSMSGDKPWRAGKPNTTASSQDSFDVA